MDGSFVSVGSVSWNQKGATTYVSFFCQSCNQPLKVDSSLLDINSSMFEELTASLDSNSSSGSGSSYSSPSTSGRAKVGSSVGSTSGSHSSQSAPVPIPNGSMNGGGNSGNSGSANGNGGAQNSSAASTSSGAGQVSRRVIGNHAGSAQLSASPPLLRPSEINATLNQQHRRDNSSSLGTTKSPSQSHVTGNSAESLSSANTAITDVHRGNADAAAMAAATNSVSSSSYSSSSSSSSSSSNGGVASNASNSENSNGTNTTSGSQVSLLSQSLSPEPSASVSINQIISNGSWNDVHAADRTKASLSHRTKVAAMLFNQLSAGSDFDHPLCVECTKQTMEALDLQLQKSEKELAMYEAFKQQQESKVARWDEIQQEQEQELKKLRLQEEEFKLKISEGMKERQALLQEIEAVEEESRELDLLEESYWSEFNDFQRQLNNFQAERDSVANRHESASRQLERLCKLNVLNDTFHIWDDGHFGVINNLRLGRVPEHHVEWNEINAAWGQTALLLYLLANKVNMKFEGWRIIPMGSFSKMEKLGDDGHGPVVMELYGSGDTSLGKIFGNKRFDNAMVGFLECLQQMGDWIQRKDGTKLQITINKDKIGDHSIRLQFNNDASWTKALKYTLINLKWILAWSSKVSN